MVPVSDTIGKRTLVSDVEVAVAPPEREAGKSAVPAYAGLPTRVRSGPPGRSAWRDWVLVPVDLAYARGREFEVGYSRIAAVSLVHSISHEVARITQSMYSICSREKLLSRPRGIQRGRRGRHGAS